MKKHLISVITTISALGIGFFLMVVPFRIFTMLSGTQMRFLLAAEIITYFVILLIVSFKKEAKKDNEKKSSEYSKRHNERINRRNNELKGIKVSDYDLVA